MEKALIDQLTQRHGEIRVLNGDGEIIHNPTLANITDIALIVVECDDEDEVDYDDMAAFLNSCID